MGNWKSRENIKYFKENNIPLSQDFLDRGYDFYVDGFTPYISFSVSYIKKDMLNGTNVGTKNLTELGYTNILYFNSDMSDGTPRKLLDVSKLKELDWVYKTSLKDGIEKTYKDYVK